MTTIQELSIKELFEVRDALVILNKYGLASEVIIKEVNEAISVFEKGLDE